MQQAPSALSTLLFPGYRRSLLTLLLLRSDEALHGREIARRVNLPSGSVIRELNRLVEVGLLNRERRGNQAVYSANRTSPVFQEIASILRKTAGLADVLKAALAPLTERIDVAFVYGSVARGAETSGSDVDVMVIGSVDFGTVVEALYPAQQQLAREINPKVFAPREWRQKLRANDPFVADVAGKEKIFLIGGRNELAKLGRHKP
jgi:predicted nucleotidyltransferase